MRDSLRVCVLALGTWFAAIAPCAANGALVISASLDDSVFVEGAPIIIALRIHNSGPDTVRIPPVDLAYGYVSFHLRHLGKDLTPLASTEGAGKIRQGLPLGTGETETGVIDILRCFGSAQREQRGLNGILGSNALVPGEYSVAAVFDASSERNPRYRLTSSWQNFSVVPLESQRREAALVSGFLSGWDRDRSIRWRNEYCRSWVTRFRDSQYLGLVFLYSGPLMRSIPPEFIVHDVFSGKITSNTRARLLHLRCLAEEVPAESKRVWLARVLEDTSDLLSRDVVKSWIRKVREKKFDY